VVGGLSGNSTVNNRGYVSAFNLYEHVYWAVKEVNVQQSGRQEPELAVL
jgi:hypothetical protein